MGFQFNPLTGQFDLVGVSSLAADANPGITGAVTLSSGANITLTQVGNDIEITSTGGGASPLTTKGDIYTYSTGDTRLPVGTDGQVLSANSGTTTGLEWVAAGGTGTVTSVASGNGMNFSTITTTGTVTLGTPSTLTVSTSNALTSNSHTHAITSSSAPGASASILATDSNGILGSTGTRIVKIWATDLTVTNAISGSITGNAGTATALATPRTIGIATGDITSAGSSFDGTANNTNAYTLATVNANVGSFTNASITVNAKGLITAASNGTTAVTSVAGTTDRITVTGTTSAVIDIAATYVGQSSITTLGTISTGVWNGTDIGLADGGTGASLTDPNADRIMFWDDSAGSVDWLTAGTGLSITGTTITATGTGGTVTSVDVSGGTTGLTFSGGPITTTGTITMSGTLDVDNGGTGQTSYTNGQLLIGNTTGNTLAKATLTAGAGISVTNGAGSITIATTAVVWNNVTGTSASAAVNNGYIANNAGLVTITLPSTAAVGDIVRVAGAGAGGWRLAQNASQVVNFGVYATTSGTGGRLDSVNRYDAVEAICITANTTWAVISSQGNVTVT